MKHKVTYSVLYALQNVPLAHGVLGYGDDIVTAAIGIILLFGFVRAALSSRRARRAAQETQLSNHGEPSLPLAANDIDSDIRRLD